jgi:predicted DNA-binding transcriptional regulator YafY
MSLVDVRELIDQAMRDPDSVVLRVQYRGVSGAATERLISPIRFNKAGNLLALCIGRGEVRQFVLSRLSGVVLVDASEVLMPSGVLQKPA